MPIIKLSDLIGPEPLVHGCSRTFLVYNAIGPTGHERCLSAFAAIPKPPKGFKIVKQDAKTMPGGVIEVTVHYESDEMTADEPHIIG